MEDGERDGLGGVEAGAGAGAEAEAGGKGRRTRKRRGEKTRPLPDKTERGNDLKVVMAERVTGTKTPQSERPGEEVCRCCNKGQALGRVSRVGRVQLGSQLAQHP